MKVNGLNGNESIQHNEKNYNITNKDQTKNIDKDSFWNSLVMDEDKIVTYEDGLSTGSKSSGQPVNLENEQLLAHTNNMSETDYEDLSKEEVDVENYTKEQLERALERISNQRVDREEYIDGQVEKLEEKEEHMEDMGKYSHIQKKVLKKLEEYNIPITKENIMLLSNALEMTAVIGRMDKDAMNYMIKNNLDPTIGNIYKATYSGKLGNAKPITDDAFHNLLPQVNTIIEKGMFTDKENAITIARNLLDNHLPLNNESIWSYMDLQSIKNNASEEAILDNILVGIKSGYKLEDIDLGTKDYVRASNLVENFNKINDEAIYYAVHRKDTSGDMISCSNLCRYENTVHNRENLVKDIHLSNLDIKAVTVRRQLEEIRYKLTVESAHKLIKQGIQVETEELSKVVEELKALEDSYYSNLIEEGQGIVNHNTIETLKTSLTVFEELKGMPSYIIGSTLSNAKEQTIESLASKGAEIKQALNKASESYETLMTTPRKDYGDSITKAFSNIGSILEDMNLENNQANERAIKILAYNGMELSNENIDRIKAYDSDVNYMMNHLHPSVTVEIIKRGMNPINIPIKELNQLIDNITNDIGVGKDEKYSKYLWKLEKDNKITEEEKDSYIGIYRLLNNINNTDGAALGAVINAGREVSLNNLLTALRTMKSGGINVDVDDNLGEIESVSYKHDRITDQIQSSFTKSEDHYNSKVSYQENVLKEVLHKVDPEVLHILKEEQEQDLWDMSIEQLHEGLNNVSKDGKLDESYWEVKKSEYADIAENSNNSLQALKHYNIPVTLANIQAMSDVLSNDRSIFHQIKNLNQNHTNNSNHPYEVKDEAGALDELSDSLLDSMTDYDNMNATYDKVYNKIMENTVNSNDNYSNTFDGIKAIQRLNRGLTFMKELARRESYEIPLVVGDSISNVNVTFIHNSNQSGKLDISMNLEHLGKIQLKLMVTDSNVRGTIICDNRIGNDTMIKELDSIKESIGQTGTQNISLQTTMVKSVISPNHIPMNEQVNHNQEIKMDTNKLYEIAKNILVHIKSMDQGLVE